MTLRQFILATVCVLQGLFYTSNAQNEAEYFDIETSKAYPKNCFYTDNAPYELMPIQDANGNEFNGYFRFTNSFEDDVLTIMNKKFGKETFKEYKLDSITYYADVSNGKILKVSYVFANVDGDKTINLDKLIEATEEIKETLVLKDLTVSSIKPTKGIVSKMAYFQKVEIDPWGW